MKLVLQFSRFRAEKKATDRQMAIHKCRRTDKPTPFYPQNKVLGGIIVTKKLKFANSHQIVTINLIQTHNTKCQAQLNVMHDFFMPL